MAPVVSTLESKVTRPIYHVELFRCETAEKKIIMDGLSAQTVARDDSMSLYLKAKSELV
jgi:hypothetical protein